MFAFLKEKIKAGIQKIAGRIRAEPKDSKLEDKKDEAKPLQEIHHSKKPEMEGHDEEVLAAEKSIKSQKPAVDEKPSREKHAHKEEHPAEEEPTRNVPSQGQRLPQKGSASAEQEIVDNNEKIAQERHQPIAAAKPSLPQNRGTKEGLQKDEHKDGRDKGGEREGERKGFFQRVASSIKEKITTTTLSNASFEEIFSELEMALLENNVAVEVIEQIRADLGETLVNKPVKRAKIEDTIKTALRESLEHILLQPASDFITMIRGKKPFIICFVGINGSGKTTTIAKIANLLKSKGLSTVIAAGDTFRAASIDQLQEHANNLGIKLIKHDYGSDPAAVAFDAIKHAQSQGIDTVLIDTAGRMHSNTNLIDEMKKIIRVAKPDLKVFVGEAITGNDCIEQVKTFDQAIGIDGIILTKADVDEKGGAMLSASFVSKKPIFFLGVGQGYGDIEPFGKQKLMERLEI